MARAVEPRVMTIEGRRVLVVDRRPPLQPSLEALRRAMRVTWETRLTRQGARTACISDQDHRMVRFLEGRHVGLDGVLRDLRLLICRDCEAVCVRDVSLDTLAAIGGGRGAARPSRLAPRRRDHVIGWYSGARPGQREYR